MTCRSAWKDEKGVELRAPWIERELGSVPQRGSRRWAGAGRALCFDGAGIADAAGSQKVAKVKNSIVTVLEPASERGKRGMDELHEQTINLLSFPADAEERL